MAVSPDGKLLVVSDCYGSGGTSVHSTVRVWDLEAMEERWTWEVKRERPTVFAFSPDSKLLAAGAGPGVVVWRVAD